MVVFRVRTSVARCGARHLLPRSLVTLFVALIACGTLSASAEATPTTIGSEGGGPGQFETIAGVAVATDGSLYTLDGAGLGDADGRLQHLTPSGSFISQWGSVGDADGQFDESQDLAVGPNGNVYALDTGGDQGEQWRIQEFTPGGELLTSWPVQQDTSCLSISADGTIYASSGQASTPTVEEYSPAGDSIGSIPLSNAQFAPSCIAIASDGSLYGITEEGGDYYVEAFSGSGEFQASWPVEYPSGLAVDSSGNVYVSEQDGAAIDEFSRSGSLEHRAVLRAGGNGYYDGQAQLAFDSADDLLYESDPSDGVVWRVDLGHPTAAIKASADVVYPGQSITFDASGSSVDLGNIVDYSWDTDGTGSFSTDTGSSPTLTTSYSTRQNLTVSVRVRSANGQTAVASVPIAVGPVGVTINDGALFTNSPDVTISAVGLPGTQQILVSNDGGFLTARAQPFAASFPWTLESTGDDRLPKTIYVRFLGVGDDNQNFTDDIILDQTPPTVASATEQDIGGAGAASASRAGIFEGKRKVSRKRKLRLTVTAKDGNSGVAAIQVSSRKSGGRIIQIVPAQVRGPRSLKRLILLPLSAAPRWVRVRDAAGNWSRWRRIVIRSGKKPKKR